MTNNITNHITPDQIATLRAAIAVLRAHGYERDAQRLESVIDLEARQVPKYQEGFNWASKVPVSMRQAFAIFYARSDWSDPFAAWDDFEKLTR